MKRVLIPIAQGSEDLETVTIYNLLIRAGIKVVLASLDGDMVPMARGLTLKADRLLADIEDDFFDAIVLPGGVEGAKNLSQSLSLKRRLLHQVNVQGWLGAICAAPALVLAPLGILEHKHATCYPTFESHLPHYLDKAVVVDGRVITSQGPGTALAFSLKLIECLLGESAQRSVKEQLLL